MNLKETLSSYSGKPKSLFKKIFVTLLFAYLPFLILYIILAVFGIMPVNFNDEKVYGLKAAIILICFAPFLVFMFSAFAYLSFVFGNFILRIFVTLLPEKK
jgi:hypothetical protein